MTLSQSILATLVYHDIFDYPLTPEEIHKYLIGKKASHPSVISSLREISSLLLAQARIKNHGNRLYALGGRQNIFTTRSARGRHSKAKLKKALFYTKILKTIPTIKLVGISGALAMNNSQKGDDIDLVIITAKNTLWSTRFLANVILLPFKRQPSQKGPSKVNNKACLNLFLDESNLKIKPQNLYMAHEICQMKPLWDRDKTYSRFIKANIWVKKYLANWTPNSSRFTLRQTQGDAERGRSITVHNSRELKPSTVNRLPAKALATAGQPSTIEILFKNFQLFYMRKRISTERIGEHQLFFHPKDTQNWVLKEYQKRLRRLKVNL